MVITGSNGSGKSTLIKLIGGLIRPSGGRIEFSDGDRVLEDAEELLPYMGLVSPEVVFYQQLTARENLSLLAQMRDVSLGVEQISAALQVAGLDPGDNRQVGAYSTGMKQRLKFALLQAIDPAVWLVDEGLSNLDEDGRRQVLSLMKDALSRCRLIVLASNEGEDQIYASQTISLPQR